LSAKREFAPAPLPVVADARAVMLADIAPLAAETVALREALGRVLAQPLSASRDQPPFAVSEMDGYALRSADTPGRLGLSGESSAGNGFAGVCGAGQAIRISTGAAIPQGADTVVMQEDVARDGDLVVVPKAEAARHIRPRAMDFARGAVLLEKGRRLDGVALALAAAMGLAEFSVLRMPRVAIVSGGDELAEPGAQPGPFQIFDSGTYGVAGLLQGWGARPQRLALEVDDVARLARAAEAGLAQNDLLVVIGGASVGDHDHARPALMRLGLDIKVQKIAVRPGKPTWFGHVQGKPVLGLPGNPASALVCAHLFLRPLLEALQGRDPQACIAPVPAALQDGLPANGAREHYLRARLFLDRGAWCVRAFEKQDSSLLSVFAAANALIRLPAGAPALAKGAMVDVLPLDRA
jgi:molybdopterin molybdotransferase